MTYQKFVEALHKLHPEVVSTNGTEAFDADGNSVAYVQADVEREAAFVGIRTKRNQLLAETDYLALSDVTLSTEMAEYRQALRDLPANTTDPANPVWPTKPGA